MPSFIVIHPTLWPQYTNVTDKTDRQTGQTQLSVAWAEAYLRTKWHLNPSSHLATTNVGQKFGGAVPPFWGSWAPILHNVAWAESTSMPCFILIHADAWQQYTNVIQSDRQDRTTVDRCLSVCPVCDVGVLWPNGWMD